MPDAVVVTASAGSFPGLVQALGRLAVPVEEHPLLTFAPPMTAAKGLGGSSTRALR